jgi:hypothetical protein
VSKILKDSLLSLQVPKLMVPIQIGETLNPLLPTYRYSIQTAPFPTMCNIKFRAGVLSN